MKKIRFKKHYILGAIIGVVFLSLISYNLLLNKVSYPFDPLRDMRSTFVSNYELLDSEKTDIGTMIYSAGKVNDNKDYVYYTGLVKRSLLGYKWVGGGGHINRDIENESQDFLFSAQLLSEEQKVKPTILGVFSDTSIRNIIVTTQSGTFNAIILEGKEGDQFYHIPLTGHSNYYIFKITNINEQTADFLIEDDRLDDFRDGKQVYFYR